MARGLLTREHCLSLYHGLAHPARALAGASCSGAAAACLHTSSSAGQATAAQSAKQQAGAASQQGAAARVGGAASKQKQQRRKRYAPEVLAYFAEVKAWNRKMSELKQQWRADLLQRHWATQAQRRAAELTALKTDVQGGTAAKQAQTVLEDELKKAETELELVGGLCSAPARHQRGSPPATPALVPHWNACAGRDQAAEGQEVRVGAPAPGGAASGKVRAGWSGAPPAAPASFGACRSLPVGQPRHGQCAWVCVGTTRCWRPAARGSAGRSCRAASTPRSTTRSRLASSTRCQTPSEPSSKRCPLRLPLSLHHATATDHTLATRLPLRRIARQTKKKRTRVTGAGCTCTRAALRPGAPAWR